MAWPSYREHASPDGGGFAHHALLDLSTRRTLPELRVMPVTDLPGVGPRIAASLKDLNVTSLADLVSHYPSRHEDLSDRKSTRLNSSHANISYAVFCLKKKKKI